MDEPTKPVPDEVLALRAEFGGLEPMPRPAWIAARKKGMGSTDIGAALGYSTFASPMDVYLDKIDDEVRPETSSAAAKRGQKYEPFVADDYAEQNDVALYDPQAMIWSPDGLPIFATPDRFVLGEDRLVECKTIHWSERKKWGPELELVVPPRVYVQVQVQLHCARRTRDDVHAMFGFEEFRTYEFGVDADNMRRILDFAAAWWRKHVEQRIPPPAKSPTDVLRLAARLWPKETDPERSATATEEEKIELLAQAVVRRKAAEQEEAGIKADLVQSIGRAAGIEDSIGRRVTYNFQQGRTNVDWKAVAKALSDRHGLRSELRELERKLNRPTESGRVMRPYLTPQED